MMVLQSPGNNLRSRSRTRVDQDNDRQAIGRIAAFGKIAFDIGLAAAALRHNFAARQEHVGHIYRFIQQTAGIGAHI